MVATLLFFFNIYEQHIISAFEILKRVFTFKFPMEYFRKAVTILEKQWLKLTITSHANLRVSTVIYAVAFSAGGFCFLCKV